MLDVIKEGVDGESATAMNLFAATGKTSRYSKWLVAHRIIIISSIQIN